jgi:chromosome segregation ATPase
MELEMLSEEARLILESIANLKGDISEIKTDVRQISGRLGEHDKALVEHTAMLENHDRNILSLYDKVEKADKDLSIHLTEDRMRLEGIEKRSATSLNWKNNWFNFAMSVVLGGIVVTIVGWSIVKQLGGE